MTNNIGVSKTFDFGNGLEIKLETGKLAKQANGSVVLTQGKTMLLATVVYNAEAKEGIDFLPLSVDYQEKFAAVGRIPGGFLKRENRPSDYEILISRLIDRAIRPLFAEDFHGDIQVLVSLISSDKDINPDALVGFAASAAIMLTDLPFNGPMSEVRVARVNGEFVINPSKSQMINADIDLIVAGTANDINMVEGEAKEISESEMVEALKFAHEYIKKQCQAQLDFVELAGGKKPRLEYTHETKDESLKARIYEFGKTKYETISKGNLGKKERTDAYKAVVEEFVASLPENHTEDSGLIKKYFHDLQYDVVRAMITNDRKRLDGRSLDQVRPIWTEVDYLPSAHGSAIFTRGETQSLTSVTLGTKLDEQMLDSPMNSGTTKFILHYNFPAFSTGEVKPNRGPGRREIGHGNLAMRGLRMMLPEGTDNPYTIRVVSDILESNGSSSMATVCAGSMALMDAGVKMKKSVSGIAMGLISDEETGKYAILSDILGDEDHLGDMDFKVVGTADGIVACQMDIKINGLRWDMVEEALNQAKAGRLHILNEMNKTISKPNDDYKAHAPRIETLIIDSEFIGAVIGPGGKVIQGIQKETGATISITEDGNKGIVEIAATEKEAMDRAMNWVKGIVAVPEVGEVYEGTVKALQDYGAFVEFLPGKEGLLHISEISWTRINTMEGVMEVGDKVKVKLVEVDKKSGKYRLSRKALLPMPEGMEAPAPREPRENREHRGDRRDNRGGDRRDNRDRDRDRDRDRGSNRDFNNRRSDNNDSAQPESGE